MPLGERALVVAPLGRDATIATGMLREAGIAAEACPDLTLLVGELARGAGVVIVTEEAVRTADLKDLAGWVGSQPPWSDLPFVLLTERGGGLERNPSAGRQTDALGNVAFLERPFHPTTLVSVVRTALRGRRRQYELRRLNETLETRVQERTAELATANRQLIGQIEERERVEATLRQMQRLEAVGQLTSGVAHDFNNLLTVVLGNIGFIEKALKASDGDPKLLQRLSYMRTAAERGAKLTQQLLAFSRRQRLEPKPLDLNETVESMRDLLHSSLGGSVQIETIPRPGLWPALVDPMQIELAVLNLAINARDAMPVGGRLTVETANATLGAPGRPEEPAAGHYVMIAVNDTGCGMPPDVRAKIFEPFFTTKEVGKGSGLGLSQVLGFAKQSGGGVRIDTRVDEGTSVKVYLPRAVAAEAPQPSGSSDTVSGSDGQGALVLLVDDDSAVREITATMLRELGYVVMEVGSGGAALEVLDRRDDIDLIVLDFAMPGMNGAAVARHAKAKRPRLPILFVTGYADISELGEVGEHRVIKKPFLDDEFAGKVRSALRCTEFGPLDHKVLVAP